MAYNIISGSVSRDSYGPRTTYRAGDSRTSVRPSGRPNWLRALYAVCLTLVMLTVVGILPQVLK